MISEQCERFRESISLGLDGMLSAFETTLLDRHLTRCRACDAFAAGVTAQTQLLRAAVLEDPPLPVTVASAPVRHRAAGLIGAIAVAAAAALLTLTPTAGQRSAVSSAITAGSPLLAVFPAQRGVDATFDVPRLRVVSPASADGPVHGDYGLPAVV